MLPYYKHFLPTGMVCRQAAVKNLYRPRFIDSVQGMFDIQAFSF